MTVSFRAVRRRKAEETIAGAVSESFQMRYVVGAEVA